MLWLLRILISAFSYDKVCRLRSDGMAAAKAACRGIIIGVDSFGSTLVIVWVSFGTSATDGSTQNSGNRRMIWPFVHAFFIELGMSLQHDLRP